MSNKIRYMYLRDDNDGPVGCLAIKLHRKKHYLEYQLSVLNPADRRHPITGKNLPFNRAVARQLAIGRLVENPYNLYLPEEATMNEVSLLVMQDLASSAAPSLHGDIPARAIKAAKLWLRNVSR